MNRRKFINIGAGIGVVAVAGLSGCMANQETPPRRSEVVDEVNIQGRSLEVSLADNMWVKTRQEPESESDSGGNNLSPIGVAQAKGRGAAGRGSGGFSSAPKNGNGWAIFAGGAYVGSWYDDHEDEVREVSVEPRLAGVGYIGTNEVFKEQAPGPGAINWDETRTVLDEGDQLSFGNELSREGWYRFGCQVAPDESQLDSDLGFDSVDFRVEENNQGEPEKTEAWVVKPRI